MPQFDVFIFFSSIFYLLIGFFGLMFYNQLFFLPKISSVLKLREKISHNNKEVKLNSKIDTLFKISDKLL